MRGRIALTAATAVLILGGVGCGVTHTAGPSSDGRPIAPSPDPAGPGRGFPDAGPWVSFYGEASTIDLGKVAATYRIINIDADPGVGRFTAAQIARLKAGGRNRVLSYFNLGSVEKDRTYWSTAPAGFVPAGKNTKAQIGPYGGYPDEVWMNPANPEWRHLLVDYVAPRLVAQGADGFYFDNLEIVEHGTKTDDGPCDAACAQGGLDLVAALRAKYPNLLFVMQNATGATTLNGKAGGAPYRSLLDGVAHEETFTQARSDGGNAGQDVYEVKTDPDVVAELKRWQGAGLRPGGRPFWVAVEDYVNSCGNGRDAKKVFASARAAGLSAYVSDKSAGQNVVCYWDSTVTG